MASQKVSLDKHSDIELLVGSCDDIPATTFQCCSRTLARSSPVFSRILYGSSAEDINQPSSTGERIVNLPHDDPVPFAVFLNIIHGHFDRVPQEIACNTLYDLIALTNHHGATRTLAPWADSWIASIKQQANHDRTLVFKILCICWELRCAGGFAEAARYILIQSNKSELADIPDDGGLKTPPDIVGMSCLADAHLRKKTKRIRERIRAIRIQTIRELLGTIDDAVRSLIIVDEKPRWSHNSRWMDSRRCESIVLGSLMFALMGAGLWPLPDANDIQESIAELRTKIASLVFYDIGPDVGEVDVDYSACNPGPRILDQIGKIMADTADPHRGLSESVDSFDSEGTSPSTSPNDHLSCRDARGTTALRATAQSHEAARAQQNNCQRQEK
ncbi:hypothetical protein G7Z17_g2755 [Cylindrodendrum hubeiense]|uniref:BTB domain-containing protein n=1 Tax=Cylindrodendrum hubeiense TaxID=595255 RepID=A0A9P5HDN1_9HYPO|nr:hypothetical protein G7Z17_g2755 [Cylindrodendrum hubeiense]